MARLRADRCDPARFDNPNPGPKFDSEMAPKITVRGRRRTRAGQWLLLTMTGASLAAVPGCGTFGGMSLEEREKANKDIAAEANYIPSLKPERSLLDDREVSPWQQ